VPPAVGNGVPGRPSGAAPTASRRKTGAAGACCRRPPGTHPLPVGGTHPTAVGAAWALTQTRGGTTPPCLAAQRREDDPGRAAAGAVRTARRAARENEDGRGTAPASATASSRGASSRGELALRRGGGAPVLADSDGLTPTNQPGSRAVKRHAAFATDPQLRVSAGRQRGAAGRRPTSGRAKSVIPRCT